MSDTASHLKPWSVLGADEQLALQLAYQEDLDRQPRTCSLDEKVDRFASWLAGRGVAFSMADLSRKPRRPSA